MSAAIATILPGADPSATRPIRSESDADSSSVATDLFSALLANLVASSAAGIGAVDATGDAKGRAETSEGGRGAVPSPSPGAVGPLLIASAAVPNRVAAAPAGSGTTAAPTALTEAPSGVQPSSGSVSSSQPPSGSAAALVPPPPVSPRAHDVGVDAPIGRIASLGARSQIPISKAPPLVDVDRAAASDTAFTSSAALPKAPDSPQGPPPSPLGVHGAPRTDAARPEWSPSTTAGPKRVAEPSGSDGSAAAGPSSDASARPVQGKSASAADPVASFLREMKGEVLPSNALRTAAAAHPIEGIERHTQGRETHGATPSDAVPASTNGRIASAGSAAQGQTHDSNPGDSFARGGGAAPHPATARAGKPSDPGLFVEGVERAHGRDKAAREIAELGHAARAAGEGGGVARVDGPAIASHREIDAGTRAVEIVRQVAEAAERARTQEGGAITLRLHPAELGRVDVKLEVVDGRVTATLTADRADVRGVIERHIGELHQALTGKGVDVHGLRVETPSHRLPDPSSDRQPDPGFDRDPGGRREGQREPGRERRHEVPEEDKPRFHLFA